MMKKTYLMMLLIAVFSLTTATAQELTEKQQAKIIKLKSKQAYKNAKTEAKESGKNFKDKSKELEKEGWKITGDHRTLELALIEHQNKIDGTQFGSVVGDVTKCRSVDACKQSAKFQAQRELATEINADFKEVANAMLVADLVSGDESNTLTTVSQRKTAANVSGLITASYSMMKDNKDGTNTFRTVFYVDLARKAKIQKEAMAEALKEAQLTVERATLLNDYVDKVFSDEE